MKYKRCVKYVVLLFILLFVFALTACGRRQANQTETPPDESAFYVNLRQASLDM